jgi:hypothetical protein
MRKSTSLNRAVLTLLLFGVSFGYVEAAVVVYLRGLSQAAVERVYPAHSQLDLFPLLTPAELQEATHPALWWTLKIELGREAATILMLAAIGLAVGRNGAESAAAFVMAFGIWDIAFYGFLKVLIHWPVSLLAWDLLFLVPVPWAGPVLAPLIVSLSMIVAGFLTLRRAWNEQSVSLNGIHWLGVLLGGFIIVLSFAWGFPGLLAGGVPHDFRWLTFSLGEAIGLGAFLHAFVRKSADPGEW